MATIDRAVTDELFSLALRRKLTELFGEKKLPHHKRTRKESLTEQPPAETTAEKTFDTEEEDSRTNGEQMTDDKVTELIMSPSPQVARETGQEQADPTDQTASIPEKENCPPHLLQDEDELLLLTAHAQISNECNQDLVGAKKVNAINHPAPKDSPHYTGGTRKLASPRPDVGYSKRYCLGDTDSSLATSSSWERDHSS